MANWPGSPLVACQLPFSGPGMERPSCMGHAPSSRRLSDGLKQMVCTICWWQVCTNDAIETTLKKKKWKMLKVDWRPCGQLWNQHLHGRNLWPELCTYDGTASWQALGWYSWGSYCYENYRYENLEGLNHSYNPTPSVTEGETRAQGRKRDYWIEWQFWLEHCLPHFQASASPPPTSVVANLTIGHDSQ